MNANGVVTSLDKIMHWVTKLAFLNFLWIVFSIFGLFVAGVFPATVATLNISRKWIGGQQDIKIWKSFKSIYRQEFISANLLGWLFALIGLVLYFNYRLLAASQGEVIFIVPFAFYIVIFMYILTVIWTFPLLAYYQASIMRHLKNALVIGLTKIHISIAKVIVIFSVLYLSLELPVLIPFYTFSICSLVWIWLSMHVFSKLDNRSISEKNL
ncbi:putative membrane protein YesL [Virgibacillus natechei]|uniref:Membrane protein YesL n=1 Tax=Virgibacillus natechei TaxID=1216297 RepID=A0ABS4IED0_9BACI|nr:YesL family protein [Virgibacillus natechei]MBP1969284.1 putative membrane protein YesL [Virgibacillus natechei]UZD12439.1 YesL family protein [Virgibacillus natechei]